MKKCGIEDCDSKSYAKGLCSKHYRRMRRHGNAHTLLRAENTTGPCSVDGCNNKIEAKGLCVKHYKRMLRYGNVNTTQRSANGTGGFAGAGYWRHTIGGKRKYKHVLVAEKAIGRTLRGTEQVHHVDGNKLNNATSNLVICPNSAYHGLLHRRTRAIPAAYK